MMQHVPPETDGLVFDDMNFGVEGLGLTAEEMIALLPEARGPAKRALDETREKVHPTNHQGTAERERSTEPELHQR